ncbi:olfactory receptor 6B3-like [Anguilla anguilla]|uniref:olfactory receptor 6B3-like n=1 Tax=Anguilla anguilla TaxID=7936 RepID=UPI0015B0C62F|nr:olfactory receptor 6B3-like [Anguilla anguilla]
MNTLTLHSHFQLNYHQVQGHTSSERETSKAVLQRPFEGQELNVTKGSNKPGLAVLIGVIFISGVSFCKSIVINSFFCDHGAVLLLACDDNPPSAVMNWTHPVTILWLPVLFITGTYICIARALFKISETSERLKAMKTCTSHLILVGVFYLPICITYAMGSAIQLNAWIVNMSLTTVLPPMLNPIIYSLKTEEFTESIKKLYRRNKIHFVVRNK